MEDLRLDFKRLLEATTPGPWSSHREDGQETYVVASGPTVIERDLPASFARYLVALRQAAEALVASRRPTRLRDLRREVEAAMRDVGAQWVFVAPAGDRYLLHNCVTRIGGAQLSRADALFLDTAKSLVPKLLATGGRPFVSIRSPCPDLGGRILIPKRAAAADVAEEYGAFADHRQPLHALSGRNDLPDRTKAMVDAIFRHVGFAQDHRVLDIGCGDATFLKRVAPIVSSVVGTVLTERERGRLELAPGLDMIDIVVASFDDLSRVSGPFDRIIANGCLHFVKTQAEAHRAFAKLATRLVPGGQLWAGEIHARDDRRIEFTSKREALAHVKARYGRSFAIAVARHVWRHRRRARRIVQPAPVEWWHIKPEEFAAFAAHHGLALEASWSCYELTGDTFYNMQERYACLLTRL